MKRNTLTLALSFAASAAITLATSDASAQSASVSKQGEASSMSQIKVGGFIQSWLSVGTHDNRIDEAKANTYDAFRVRRARVKVTQKSGNFGYVLLLDGAHSNVLFDAKGVFAYHELANLTAGQFKVPVSGTALRSATAIDTIDFPNYVGQLLKPTFRDVGAAVGTGKKGAFNGVFHYQVGAFNGGGPVAVFAKGNDDAGFLFAGRFTVGTPNDFEIAGKKASFSVGAGGAHSRYDAAENGSVMKNRMGKQLGFENMEYRVQVITGEAVARYQGGYLRAEFIRDDFFANDGSQKYAYGYGIEAGYAMIPKKLSVIGAVDFFDPTSTISMEDGTETAQAEKKATAFIAGLNYTPGKHIRVSLNVMLNRESEASFQTMEGDPAGQVRNDVVRTQLQYKF